MRGLLAGCKALCHRSVTILRSFKPDAQSPFFATVFDLFSGPRKHKTFQEEMPLEYPDGLYEYAKILTSNNADAEALVLKAYLHAAKTLASGVSRHLNRGFRVLAP
jgi:hypothetical protein